MAKQEILYVCEICGYKYQDKKAAEECEKLHYQIVEIAKVGYDMYERKKEFPLSINVRLKNKKGDTKVIKYIRA